MTRPLVFISHSSADKKSARNIAECLRARDVEVWIDQERIRFGDSIPSKISEGLDASDVLIVLVSEAFVKSSWCRAEYEPMLSKEIEEEHVCVIAVRLDDTKIPSLLSRKRYVDLTKGIDDSQLQKLCDDIWDGYSTKCANQISEELTHNSFEIFRPGTLFDLVVPRILSELSITRLADETLGSGKSLIDLYRAVDRLIDRFQTLIDQVSRILISDNYSYRSKTID